ncbi:MAG TPA: ABC transporter permease [Terriglobia bacterium]|nr:ABC transporter permease [Terriglobia bacterium]
MANYLPIFVVAGPILAWLAFRSRAKGGGDPESDPRRILRSFLEWFGELAIFCGQLVRAFLTPPYEGREFLRQLDEVGSKSLPLIALAGAATGVVMSLQTRDSLVRFGAKAVIPAVIIMSMIRETGPIITGLVLSGRVGAGIGAELGAMKVTEQIDAMEVSAVNPYKFLVATRVLACALMLPLLTLVANFCGIMMGWISTTLADPISLRYFMITGFKEVAFSDFVPPTLKTIVFGAIIGVIGCFQGMRTRGGTEGVGRSATNAVVLASLFVILADVILVRLILTFFPY